jgi:UDP-N-acetylglucosamine acyltransferase
VDINRGTSGGGGVTTLGNDNFVMAYSHVAHDCHIGDSTILANAATLAGHVLIEDFSTVGAFSGIHQFCRIGRHAFIGGYSVITKDAFPFCKTVGNRPRIYGLNSIGLRRRGFTSERLACLKKIFRIFFQSKLNTSQAIERIRAELEPTEDLQYILDFVATSKRGIIKR